MAVLACSPFQSVVAMFLTMECIHGSLLRSGPTMQIVLEDRYPANSTVPEPPAKVTLPPGEPSSNPWKDLEKVHNEPLWFGWDNQDKDQVKAAYFTNEAFHDLPDFLKSLNSTIPQFDVALARWLGTGNKDKVVEVFDNIASCSEDFSECFLTVTVAGTINVQEDWGAEQHGCQSGSLAYTDENNKGYFHFCPKGWEKPISRDVSCDKLDNYINENARSRTSVFVHELTHVAAIVVDVLAINGTADLTYDPLECFKLDPEAKLTNAENWANFANELFFSSKCGVTFQDPV